MSTDACQARALYTVVTVWFQWYGDSSDECIMRLLHDTTRCCVGGSWGIVSYAGHAASLHWAVHVCVGQQRRAAHNGHTHVVSACSCRAGVAGTIFWG